RLACVRPAASVRSEPGSNSQVDLEVSCKNVHSRLSVIAHRTCDYLRRMYKKRIRRHATERRLRIPFVRLFTMSKKRPARDPNPRLKQPKTGPFRGLIVATPRLGRPVCIGFTEPGQARI